jgi:hypothetical protein
MKETETFHTWFSKNYKRCEIQGHSHFVPVQFATCESNGSWIWGGVVPLHVE